jgi:hypothetical protein
MAVIKMNENPRKITVSGTDENEIDWSKFPYGKDALIKLISGTSVQFSTKESITSDSASLQSSDDRMILHLQQGVNLKFKGGAGSEVFSITIV